MIVTLFHIISHHNVMYPKFRTSKTKTQKIGIFGVPPTKLEKTVVGGQARAKSKPKPGEVDEVPVGPARKPRKNQRKNRTC